jgi:protein tyrosine phosphatase
MCAEMCRQSSKICAEYANIPKIPSDDRLERDHPDKNRYTDVVPYRNNTVTVAGKYINASFISSPLHRTAYIATQAPLPHTVETFWKMIDQYEVPAIYMLTKLVEKGRNKAYPYWGDVKETLDFERITVTLEHENEYNYTNLRKRVFRIRNKNTGTIRTVNHYMYTGWPDYGVPMEYQVLEKLLNLMDRYYTAINNSKLGMQVIHCSAGVGRTGVLLALHIHRLARKINRPLSFRKIVLVMRSQRLLMVNTDEQYEFLYAFSRYSSPKRDSLMASKYSTPSLLVLSLIGWNAAICASSHSVTPMKPQKQLSLSV